MSDLYKEQFLNAAKDWVCPHYSIDVRYIVYRKGDSNRLVSAFVGLSPLLVTEDMNFRVETNDLIAGQVRLSHQTKNELLTALEKAAHGQIDAHGQSFFLDSEESHNYFSEIHHGPDRWFTDLNLQIVNHSNRTSLSYTDQCRIDNELRQCTPSFDGLADLASWLALKDPQRSFESPSVDIRILPPVDLFLSECSLAENQLHIVLRAHSHFDLSRLGLAVRAAPGSGIASRMQTAASIEWKDAIEGQREGVLKLALDKADSALIMLTIGDNTVRRQWFLDAAKSSNNRMAIVQHFDKELRRIRLALEEPGGDSARFELGVAALLFLMGFSPAVQLETDAPDVVAITPSGRVILFECTVRTADFSSKLGKLVDRKGSIRKAFEESKNHSDVHAMLVCALPRDQIAVRRDELKTHQVILMTKEDLLSAFDQIRFHLDPDKFVNDAIEQGAREDWIRP